MTRVLAILGSGETAPTHTTTHRRLMDRVGGGPGVLLDTPYGFQANADDISQRAVEYFDRSVQRPISVATWRRADDPALVRETALTRVRGASYVFAGPGSPTYALRQWAGTPLPSLLAEKLAPGSDAVVTFASAAALTLGRVTVPVYEIYKVGEEPRWFDGLDLVGAVTGWSVAVIPHFDNAEGGGHDTRFCYLGEPRLQVMEAQLPDGAWVLGVDEHTGLLLDLDEGTATITGLGTVTVRSGGQVHLVVPAGETVPMDALRAAAEGDAVVVATGRAASDPEGEGTGGAAAGPADPTGTPLMVETARIEAAFDAALAARDAGAAVAAVLELDDLLEAWRADTNTSDEPDRVRAVVRSMIVRLGELAVAGSRDPRSVVGPFVDLLLADRAEARAGKDWGRSDAIRDRLAAVGVEVRDTPQGQTWELAGSDR